MLDQHGHAASGRRFEHFFQAHPHEAHPVLERTAVFVAPMVGVGREELRNQIAVARVHLHRIEPGFVGRADRLPEILGEGRALAAPHAAHESGGVEVEPRRCADREASGRRPMGHVAAVADLDACRGTLGVDGVGHVAQPRNDFGPQPQLFVERHAAAVDRSVSYRGHAHAAAGDRHVVILELLRGAEILAHRLECRRADGAVAQGQRTQLIGGEQVGHFG